MTESKSYLSWATGSKKAVESECYQGVNIMKKLEDSLFGKIKATILALFGEAWLARYTLPKVIIVGGESTGKSSALENIMKCQIFPRNSTLCTKCPIKVVLTQGLPHYKLVNGSETITFKNKNEIYPAVCKIMSKMSDSVISSTEIAIHISDRDLPNFEFYDLPGIRAFPQDMADQTSALVRKYLQDQNAIVICVVPATTPRLTTCQSIALILEAKMQKNCILALTMVDRLQPEHIEDLLVKRIIGMSDEVRELGFAGCVGIVNRTHVDTVSLEKNDTYESKWFDTNLIQGIPTNYNQYKSTICANITISNLILKMDMLYNSFIRTDWKPKIIANIEAHQKDLIAKYEALGIEVVNAELGNSIISKRVLSTFTIPRGTFGASVTQVTEGSVCIVYSQCEDIIINAIAQMRTVPLRLIIEHINLTFDGITEHDGALVNMKRYGAAKIALIAKVTTIYEGLCLQLPDIQTRLLSLVSDQLIIGTRPTAICTYIYNAFLLYIYGNLRASDLIIKEFVEDNPKIRIELKEQANIASTHLKKIKSI